MKSRKRSSLTLSAILTSVLHLVAIGPFPTTASADHPIPITSLADITSSSGHYYLTTNIVVSGAPAGSADTYIGDFSGTLNGNGFTISDLSAPLFRDITGSVSNLNLITTAVGITSEVPAPDISEEGVGVLAKEIYGNVSGVNVAGKITASGRRYVGGLTSKVLNGARVSNSSSSVSITTTRTFATGGLIGFLAGATIETSTSTGSVTTFGASEGAGGFVGTADGSSSILSSASSGNVSSDYWDIGGFAGSLYGTNILIKNSQSSGSVTVTDINDPAAAVDVGGFIGYSGVINVQNVLASGNVTAGGWNYVGGLIGLSYSNVSNSIATGNVVGGDKVGGLIGDSVGSTTNSRASGTVVGTSNFGALIGKGAAQTNPPTGTDLDLLNTGQSPAAWGQNQNINGGKPYILALINRGFYLVTTPPAPAPAAQTEAEAKAAAAVAAAKREAEVKTARADISKTLEKADKLTADAFAKAEIAGVTSENFAQVQAEILALPAELRTDINQVLKVARKFEVVGKIASEQAITLPISAFVEVGLIPADSKNKVALIAAIRRASADTRDSFADIQAVIAAEAARIQDRKDRLAATLARLKSK